jgi:plastocyanin
MSFVSRYRRGLVTLLALALSALLVLSFACGGGDDDDEGGDGTGTAAATTPADTGNGGNGEEVTFDVEMTDEAYTPNDFTVARGAQVTLNLNNAGTAIHNVRIAGEDDKYNTADDAVSDPDLITGGDTGTVKWTAPNKAGEYKYQCDIHPNLGGIITVQ